MAKPGRRYAATLEKIAGRILDFLGGGERRIAWIALALIGVGILLRTWHFSSDRSLWLDEAMVATSIVGRDWQGLLDPLAYGQLAPVGWLWIEKAALETIGGLEHTLRSPQFIFGLASMALFTVLARGLLNHVGFLAAVALFASSDPLVLFSAEVKPYGADVFFSIVFLFFGMRYFYQKAPLSIVGILALAVAGAVAVACCFPSVIVLAGFGLALFLRELMLRERVSAVSVAAVGVLWLLVFAYFFLSFYNVESENVDTLSDEWELAFAPLPPTSFADIKWYGEATHNLFWFMFGSLSTIPAVIASLIGGWALLRKSLWFGASLLVIFVIALFVSGLHLYPFGARLSLYLLPQLILLAAAGVEVAVSTARPKLLATSLATAMVAAGSASALWQHFMYFPQPYATENIRPILEQVAQKRTAGQPIYVDAPARPAFQIYQDRVGLGDATVIEGKPNDGDLGCLLADIDGMRKHKQAWFIYSHAEPIMNQSEAIVFAQFASMAGKEVVELQSVSVHAYLFEFGAEQADRFTSLVRALPPTIPCL